MKAFFYSLVLLFSSSVFAEIQLKPLPLGNIGEVEQITLDDKQQLLMLNKKGELWKMGDKLPLLKEISPQIAPQSRYGKIAAMDKNGHFLLWENGKEYRSNVVISPYSGMVILPFAVIAVQRENGKNRLVRLELNGSAVKLAAVSETEVLPDTQPLQIHFHGENSQGHIAVLAKPDTHTYQHGVLGDEIEAAELQFLERHNLQPLATTLSQPDLAFEANRLAILPTLKGNKIIAVMSGDGEGAKAVLVTEKAGKLVVEAQSQPLQSNRWQSPFVFNGKLYAVQMPHLAGRLVEYEIKGSELIENHLANGLSNHQIGRRETDLTAVSAGFAVIPQIGYRQVAVLNSQGKLTALSTQLPANIVKTLASDNIAYLLLANGEIWQVKSEN
ncbi:MAG: hypothetical protein Q4B95_03780 [Lonepinella koalarum]|nr:hypothetical protein [Lonepinella koalarum]